MQKCHHCTSFTAGLTTVMPKKTTSPAYLQYTAIRWCFTFTASFSTSCTACQKVECVEYREHPTAHTASVVSRQLQDQVPFSFIYKMTSARWRTMAHPQSLMTRKQTLPQSSSSSHICAEEEPGFFLQQHHPVAGRDK